jgi:hypothetical protein
MRRVTFANNHHRPLTSVQTYEVDAMPRKMADIRRAHNAKREKTKELYAMLGITKNMTTSQLIDRYLKFAQNNPTRVQAQRYFLKVINASSKRRKRA